MHPRFLFARFGNCRRFVRRRELAIDERLLAAAELDQRVRGAIDASRARSHSDAASDNPISAAMRMAYMCTVDVLNADVLRAYLHERGWPRISKQGPELDKAAWLLLLHAVHDQALQELALEQTRELVRQGDTHVENFARLQDRHLVLQGKPQIYGTQFSCENGRWTLDPVDDLERARKRLEELGLGDLKIDDGEC